MTKHLVSIAALAFALTGSTFAADLPRYKAPLPPPPPPPALWTGFYVGLNAGGAWGDNNGVNLASFGGILNPVLVGDPHADAVLLSSALGSSGTLSGGSNGGFSGGGQIGYNWQFAGSVVAGIEADIQGVAASHSNAVSFSAVPVAHPDFAGGEFLTSLEASKRLDYIGTVRGRLGYLVTPTLLAYVTGGLAYGGVQSRTTIFQGNSLVSIAPAALLPSFASGTFSDTRVGWTVGGGLEWMFLPNWSAKVEYFHYDLGTVTYAISPLVTGVINVGPPIDGPAVGAFPRAATRFSGNIVRAGVNYHFNWGDPAVVATY